MIPTKSKIVSNKESEAQDRSTKKNGGTNQPYLPAPKGDHQSEEEPSRDSKKPNKIKKLPRPVLQAKHYSTTKWYANFTKPQQRHLLRPTSVRKEQHLSK